MRRDPRKYLFDIRESADLIASVVSGMVFKNYLDDRVIRSAVERQLEIVGEAMRQLATLDPDLAGRLEDHHRSIGMRNILIHGYDIVDHEIVWDTATNHLPILRAQVDALLRELDAQER